MGAVCWWYPMVVVRVVSGEDQVYIIRYSCLYVTVLRGSLLLLFTTDVLGLLTFLTDLPVIAAYCFYGVQQHNIHKHLRTLIPKPQNPLKSLLDGQPP